LGAVGVSPTVEASKKKEQERKFEEMRKKHDDELEAVKKSSEVNRLAFEKRQKEMDGMLSYLVRMSQNSQSQSP
jgi:hypothetical protein